MGDALVLSKVVIALGVMALFALSATPRHKLNAKSGDRDHDVVFGPRMLQWLGMTSGIITLAVGLAFTFMSPNSGLRSPWTIVDAAAALMAIAGLCLRLWAMAKLGPLFTFTVGIRTGHKLVTSGPYSVLRHPSYTGMVLGCAGYVAFVHLHRPYPLTMAVQVCLMSMFLFVRVRNEEAVLAREFGRAWDAHCARTWRFVPYVF